MNRRRLHTEGNIISYNVFHPKLNISNTQANHVRGTYFGAGNEAVEATLDQLLDHEEGHTCVEADQGVDNE